MVKFLYVFVLIALAHSCVGGAGQKTRLLNGVIHKHAKIVKRDYRLCLDTVGGSIPDEIRGFTVSFTGNQKLTIDQTRELIVRTSQDMINLINADEKIRPHLANYPVDVNNLKYSMAFLDPQGRYVDQNYVAFVFISNGKIHYDSYDHQKRKYIKLKSEPYQEAKEIVMGHQLN